MGEGIGTGRVGHCWIEIKTLDLAIMDILFQDNSEDGMTSYQIENKLKEIEIERTYDTLSKHLKKWLIAE